MFLADYHTHCLPYSPDASCTMEEAVQGAIKNGVTHLCLTNHNENANQDAPYDQFPPFYDWEGMEREFLALREKYQGRIDLRLGCEVSSPHYVPEEGRIVCGQPMFDFIIGSIHNLRSARDFYYLNYPEDFDNFRPAVEKYIDEYINLTASGMCDVLGHIGYMQKYMARQGKGFDLMFFEDRLRELFRLCVERGVGIEVNTSALRDALSDFMPPAAVVKLYRECGGEIITVGSDAHQAQDYGQGVREGYELLLSLGFSYVCLFKNHKPEFVRIGKDM